MVDGIEETSVRALSKVVQVMPPLSDVTTTSQAMRRLVLTHAVVAFAFNTVIIAITVGVAASLI